MRLKGSYFNLVVCVRQFRGIVQPSHEGEHYSEIQMITKMILIILKSDDLNPSHIWQFS